MKNKAYQALNQNIGYRIYLLRKAAKMTQIDLAKSMNMTFQQIQKYEEGINCLNTEKIWQLCQIFNIEPNFFFENFEFQQNIPTPEKKKNLLYSDETLELVSAYYNIQDRKLAKKIFDLMTYFTTINSTNI